MKTKGPRKHCPECGRLVGVRDGRWFLHLADKQDKDTLCLNSAKEITPGNIRTKPAPALGEIE